MKIRNGFVSNSSSSSFVVVFPHAPDSADDVFIMLFRTQFCTEDKLDVEVYDQKLSKREISKMVWEDIEEQRNSKERKEKLIEDARRGTDDALEIAVVKFLGPEPDYNDPACKKDYQIYHDLKYKLLAGVNVHYAIEKMVDATQYCTAQADRWQEINKYNNKLDEFHWNAVMEEIGDNEFYVFHYGDSHGDRRSTVLEHGGIFDRLLHWRFSHH